ncbi:hypothetical protein M3J09_009223 [Ascochyta lentis]
MPTPKRRAQPCEACRGRHLKCDVEGSDKPCSNCKRADVSCIRPPKRLRFKDVVKFKRAPGFTVNQPWLQPSSTLSFLDETAAVAKASNGPAISTRTDQLHSPPSPQIQTEQAPGPQSTVTSDQTSSSLSPECSAPTVNADAIHHRPWEDSYAPSESLAHAVVGLSPTTIIATTPSPITTQDTSIPNALPIGLQEACLIRHFTAKLAHAFDTTDRDAHYTLTLPHRAMNSPVLLYAICTVSSRLLTSWWYSKASKPTVLHFDNIPLPELDESSAIHYHNACLGLLLDFANIPVDKANAEAHADALAATTILRTYEQLDTSLTGLDAEVYQGVVQTVMSKHHDVSIYSLENMDKKHRDERGDLILAEGLRTSACLIALRQEIWSVLLYRRPFRLPLAENMDYSTLGPTDDFTWANRLILWCADVARFCFGSSTSMPQSPEKHSPAYEKWRTLKDFADRWTANPPAYFRPLYHCPARPERGDYFPVIWQLNDAHIIAMQHLELGRMLLAVYNPRRQRVGIGSSASNLAIERQLRESIKVLCGLALADKRFQAGMTVAAIGISIGGEFFDNVREQGAIVGFLKTLEEEHAWPTRSIIDALQTAWGVGAYA